MIPESDVPAIPHDPKRDEFEAACLLARKAIYDPDGRGMVGRNRNYLEYRVARLLLKDRASRLPRQEDEVRKAALEEAAKVCDQWTESSWQSETFAAGTIADEIRALKEAGHG